jgi:hypothetical protein
MERTFVHRVRLKPPRVGVSVTNVCQQWSFEGGTAPVIGVPYSATETVESATAYRDDNRTVQGNTNRRLYRDSHGRTRVDSVFIPAGSEDNPVPTGISINDPVAGKQYWLNPEQKVFNAVPWQGVSAIYPPMAAPIPSTRMNVLIGYFQGAPESECKTVSLGEQVVDGIKVVGTRVEHAIPTGTFRNQKPIDIRVEQWFSPELGLIIQTTRWSSIGTEAIHRLEQVVRAEPDATLFTVPPDYTDAGAAGAAALAARGHTSAVTMSSPDYSRGAGPSQLPETPAAPFVRMDVKHVTASDWKSWLARWNCEQLERIDPTYENLLSGSGLTVENTLLLRYGIPPEVRASGWLGYPAATEKQVKELEARLGKVLPPSYRAFLKASNGFRQPQLLVWRLLPAEEVEWFRVRNQETIDIWKSVEDLSDTLEISAREIAGSATYLLNPNVIAADGEWEALYYAHWRGTPSVRYPSFWDLMQQEYKTSVLYARGAGQLGRDDDLQLIIVNFPALIRELEREIHILRQDPYVSGTQWSHDVVAVLEEAKTRVIAIQEKSGPAEEVLRQLKALAVEYRDKEPWVREGIRYGWHQVTSAIWWYLNGRHLSM